MSRFSLNFIDIIGSGGAALYCTGYSSKREGRRVSTKWDQRFLSSTRGQVASLLRSGNLTVEDLARRLSLTDNAVRAHLSALERDGLVAQGESRRGGGKPSFTYGLTPEAERLFPKPYGLLLTQLLDVLSSRLPANDLEGVLREVGQRVADDQVVPEGDLQTRIDQALGILASFGGAATIERTREGLAVHGVTCPIAAAVDGSPDACLILEAVLSKQLGIPVQQACDHGSPPHCHFIAAITTPE
jgi:predicted ArsR family transcriptional regulator